MFDEPEVYFLISKYLLVFNWYLHNTNKPNSNTLNKYYAECFFNDTFIVNSLNYSKH